LPNWNHKMLKSVLLPGGVTLLAAATLAHTGWLTLPLSALTFLYYCATLGALLLAWRFHSSRVFMALLLLFLAGQGVAFSAGHPTLLVTIVRVLTVLVPLNFALIAGMSERGFTTSSTAPFAVFLFLQSLTVAIVCGASERGAAVHPHHLAAAIPFSDYALVVIGAVEVFIAARFFLNRKPLDAAFFWALFASLLSLRFAESARTSTLYAIAAACILGASIVENSYLMAYHDELTGLPSRRAFNDAMLRLRPPYSIAVVDIDHFKRFNDNYGHEIGDQVLRLVAANLGRVSGGGHAYRCGGEEFVILFPGTEIPEVVPHLEKLRGRIQSTEFRMRGQERRQLPRGPDRRTPTNRGRTRKAEAIRQLAKEKPATLVSVTVSIGVATGSEKKLSAEAVLQAADKALYRAKDNGRNRVETDDTSRRTRVSAAGIA
jgi:diguanylate cyclase (GGDEF)-like protein